MNDGGGVLLGACRSCGHDAYIVDFERGTYTCVECGCVDEQPLVISGSGYSACYDKEGNKHTYIRGYEPPMHGAFVESVGEHITRERKRRRVGGASPPYQRRTYFAERIAQWRLREPDIPSEDFAMIQEAFNHFTDKYGLVGHSEFPGAQWVRRKSGMSCTYIIGKEDCRRLLWHLDRTRNNPRFVKKYLVS